MGTMGHAPKDSGLWRRGLKWLQHPRAPSFVVALGLALVLPSLNTRLVLDDFVIRLFQTNPPGVRGLHYQPLDVFRFMSNEADNRLRIDQGVMLPWWADPHLLLAGFRPVSSFTHLVDGWLWPHSTVLMQVHSLAWFLLALVLLLAFYRRIGGNDASGGSVATLALLLFAVDDTHGPTLSWIANRNAVIAACFGLMALLVHDRWRKDGFLAGALLGPFFFAAALLSGEIALAIFGYLLAYELFLVEGPVKRRLLALLPYGGVVLAWGFVYHALGYGGRGSDVYHDPVQEPLAFATDAVRNVALLMMGQFGLPGSDLWAFMAPKAAGVIVLVALATVAVGAAVVVPFLRRDRTARFFCAGMLLSAVPVAAAIPGDRLLLLVSVGAMGLLARMFSAWWGGDWPRPSGRFAGAAFSLVLGAIALRRLAVAPVLLPLRARTMEAVGRILDRANDSIPKTPEIARANVILVSTPATMLAAYVEVMRAVRDEPRPLRLRWLASGGGAVRVQRASPRSLVVRPENGYYAELPDKLYRNAKNALARGDTIDLGDMRAQILDLTPDGRPWEVEFRFTEPLESPSYVWMTWAGNQYVPWTPPEVGALSTLSGNEFLRIRAD